MAVTDLHHLRGTTRSTVAGRLLGVRESVWATVWKTCGGGMAGRRCPFCAEQIRADAILCRWCGRQIAELAEGMDAAAGGTPAPEQHERRGSRTTDWLVVLAIASGLAVAGTSLAWVNEKAKRTSLVAEESSLRQALTGAQAEVTAAGAEIRDAEQDGSSLRAQVSALRDDLADALDSLDEARNQARQVGDLESQVGDLRSQVRSLNATIDLQEQCIDDLVYAYNSATFASELPRNFQAAINGATCSELGYYLSSGD
jgi:DNA repair exonuclease SbcCD ATPase subunit